MKTYSYTARNECGEEIEGVLEVEQFTDVTREIQARGLELVSLEELRHHAHELKTFVFDALDKSGQSVQGSIQGGDAQAVRRILEEEFGYQVKVVRVKGQAKHKAEVKQSFADEASKNSAIIFTSEPKFLRKSSSLPEQKLQKAHLQLQGFLDEGGKGLSDETRETLLYLDGKIHLLRKSQNKKHWKQLKYQIHKAVAVAERELRDYEEQQWKAYDQRMSSREVPIDFQDDLEADVRPKKVRVSFLKRLRGWLDGLLDPNIASEAEVLKRQRYESLWTESQRFSGALLLFYLGVSFSSYFLKRMGEVDNFLVRIYDTLLFQQLVFGLFVVFSLLSFRLYFMKKQVLTDGVVVVAFVTGVWFLL